MVVSILLRKSHPQINTPPSFSHIPALIQERGLNIWNFRHTFYKFSISMKLIEASTTIDQEMADRVEGTCSTRSPPSEYHPASCSFTSTPTHHHPCPDASCLNCPLIIVHTSRDSSAPWSTCSNNSSVLLRQCRICLLDTDTRHRPLITPCRCAGSVQHVHRHCLAHWIEVSSRKSAAVPRCELCGYRYRRNAFIDLVHLHFPFMELSDKVLNIVCLLLLVIMGICAWVTVYHISLVEQRMAIAAASSVAAASSRMSVSTNARATSAAAAASSTRGVTLAEPDLTELIGKTDQKFLLLIAAAVLFFCAFFLALFTQYRAEVTVFRAITRFWATNRNWRIRNYSPAMDAPLPHQRFRRLQCRLFGTSNRTATAATTAMAADRDYFRHGEMMPPNMLLESPPEATEGNHRRSVTNYCPTTMRDENNFVAAFIGMTTKNNLRNQN